MDVLQQGGRRIAALLPLASIGVLLVLAGCGTTPIDNARADADDARSLVIVHTNDFHGHIAEGSGSAGAARIAAFFRKIRAQHNSVLVLDAGDAISGTPVSTLFSGLPIYEVMNQMGYDIGLIGNHEFDHGFRQIAAFRAAAGHPLLTANARGPDGQLLGDMPYQIVQRGELRIAVIGVLTETTPSMITPLGNEGVTFEPVEATLRRTVAQLDPIVDLIVVLSHTGHERELALAAAIPGIDVIVGGHSHSRVEEPLRVGATVVAQAHEYGKAVGVLELRVDAEGAVELVDGRLVDADDLPAADEAVAQLVAGWEQQVSQQVDVEIAQSSRLIAPAEIRDWMERVVRTRTGSELAYYNAGGVRDAIRPGVVTARTIWNIEPFGNSVVTLRLTGAQIAKLLMANRDDVAIELDPERRYLLATNSFVGAHARKTFGDDIELRDTGLLVRDVLIDAIREDGLPGAP